MKILSFSHDAELYGAQRSLLGLLRGLRRRGHEVILALPDEGSLAEEANRSGINFRVLSYPYPSSRPLRAFRFILRYPHAAASIRSLVRELSPDLVHFNTAACVAPAAALARHKLPKIWHLREAAPFRKLMSRMIARWSDAVIFNCQHIASAYPHLRAGETGAVVYNGLEVVQPSAGEIEIERREFGWDENDVVALFAGQLRPHKDPLALIEALAAARSRGVEIKGCVAGKGPLLPVLKRKVSHLGLDEQVSIAGFRGDAIALMAAADIVVCPSLVEPFPRVGLEAMALGLPVVASAVGGIPEQVAHGETGLLFPPGDREKLAEALIKLAGDPQLRKALGDAGKQRHRTLFSEEAYSAGVEKVMQQLVRN